MIRIKTKPPAIDLITRVYGILLNFDKNYLRFANRSLSTSSINCATVVSSNNQTARPESLYKNWSEGLLRNVGIVAHINAGKTTTTERILYHAGSTQTIGEVDKGNTITDYLSQERDRGITITSAAVTCKWRGRRINLIDTPGHVDFTIEVERSLSVLDGAVTILDASAGVEAQTVTVWNQARKYSIPNVIFLNKFDKAQANLQMCLQDLKTELNIRAGLLHVPVKQNTNEFRSFIDVINRKLITWKDPEKDNGSKFCIESLTEGQNEVTKLDRLYLDHTEIERERLINHLSDCDESFAGHVIDCDKIIDVSGEEITSAIKRATLACKFSPVLVGSSFKHIGVQQLMDAIVEYLPSPAERERQILEELCRPDNTPAKSLSPTDPCAFIFKIMHDKRLGPLSYIRVYGNQVKAQQRLKNLGTGKVERIKKTYRAFADELQEIESPIERGDIVVVTGLTESRTGDILVKEGFVCNTSDLGGPVESGTTMAQGVASHHEPTTMEQARQKFQLLNNQILVPQLSKIEPVYFCTIESRTSAKQMKLEEALACLAREDPSVTYEIDSLGRITVRGMGKLHLEVTRDRIETEHSVSSLLGPMQISYRETIQGSIVEELQVNRMINGINNTLNMRLYVRSKPLAGSWTSNKLRLDMSSESNLSKLRMDHRKAIEAGLAAAMRHGPSLGYPMIDCDVLLLDFKANYKCGLPIISSAASQCLAQALKRCSPVLLEPIMLLEVVAPKDFNGSIIGDLTSTRRGLVVSTQARSANNSVAIRSHTPLATLAEYSEYLRTLTSGRASFSMELYDYVAVSEAEKRNIVRI